jgi:hypothetical protein
MNVKYRFLLNIFTKKKLSKPIFTSIKSATGFVILKIMQQKIMIFYKGRKKLDHYY